MQWNGMEAANVWLSRDESGDQSREQRLRRDGVRGKSNERKVFSRKKWWSHNAITPVLIIFDSRH